MEQQSVLIKVINESGNPMPEYKTPGSAGMDLQANLTEDIILKPGQRHMVPTGIFLEIPEGHEVQVRPRSGLAFNHGVTCLNSPGTVDSDYRGEIKVILVNLGQENFVISNGLRIAQMVLAKVEKAMLVQSETLADTTRGHGGFGHTGV